MKFRSSFLRTVTVAAILVALPSAFAQTFARPTPTPIAATALTVVPALVPYSGFAIAADSKPLSGDLAITFQVFIDPTGGEPLFTETQMVSIDASGHYTAHLGASNPRGLPSNLFATGQARWLDVQIAGQVAQPRILLASVPYALKAADSATLGGLPASAFALAGSNVQGNPAASTAVTPDAATTVTTAGGTANKLAKFSGTSTIVNSIIYDNGTDVGIGTTSPTATLTVTGTVTVNGASTFNGALSIQPVATATASAARDSQQLKFYASVYNSSSKSTVAPHFIWQAEPTGNNTSSPGATLNLLATAGSGASETGFYFNTNGTIHFASAQTFPAGTGGGGSGTITGVTAGTALTGGGTSGKVTLNVDTTKVPLLASNNTFAGSQTITGNEYLGGDLAIGNVTNPDALIDVESYTAQTVMIAFADAGGATAIEAQGGADGGVGGYFFGGNAQAGTYAAGVGIMVQGGESDNGESEAGAVIQGGISENSIPGDGIDVTAGESDAGFPSYAGYFTGSVGASGTISGGSQTVRIDHPFAPSSKYLNHASTESSEMMNIYSGNVTTDASGLSTIKLPTWFEAINTDFRYQLTVVGQFAQAIIKSKIAGGQFSIMTNAPNVEVSWMITALRQDAYAKAHPMIVEQTKPLKEQGFYIHPELYGQPKEKQTEWGRHPRQMQRLKAVRAAKRQGKTIARAEKPASR